MQSHKTGKLAACFAMAAGLLLSGLAFASNGPQNSNPKTGGSTLSSNTAAPVLTAGKDCNCSHGQPSCIPSLNDHKGRTADMSLQCHKARGYYTSKGSTAVPHNVNQ